MIIHRWRLLGAVILMLPLWAGVSLRSSAARTNPNPPFYLEVRLGSATHVQPGDRLSAVVTVDPERLTGPLTFGLDLPVGLQVTSVEARSAGASCTTAAQAVACQAPAAGSPHQAIAHLVVAADAPHGTALTVTATASLSGTTLTARATVVVQVLATPTPSATALPPTPPASPEVPATASPRVPTPSPPRPDTPVPTAEVSPVSAPMTPLVVPAPTGAEAGDRFENNYDPAHATLLVPGAALTDLTLVAPSATITGDVDYVQWFGKAGRCYVLATSDLHPELDTNIEIVTAQDVVLAGNDDAAATTAASTARWCPAADGPLYGRVAQQIHVPLPDPRGKTYRLTLRVEEGTPTPRATPSAGAALPVAPPISVPASPSGGVPLGAPVVPALTRGTPVITVSTTVGVSPVSAPSVLCGPFATTPTAIEDTQIIAGIETCEAQIQLSDLPMPTGAAHVAASQAALYSGPGAQYARLAVLPAGMDVQMTGLYRNGWVAVRLVTVPLIGWVFAAHLGVDAWDAVPLPAVPPTPLPQGVVTPTLPIPTPNVGSSSLALPIQRQPSQRINLVVQACAGADTTARCAPTDGIQQAPIEVRSLTGDLLAQGITDGSGRWMIQLSRTAGRVVIGAPLLGRTTEVDLGSAPGSQLLASLIVRRVDIPATFR